MFQADAATMKISVNTAIEVVVGFENTSGNSAEDRDRDRDQQQRVPGGAPSRDPAPRRHCARTAALPNRPFGMNESTTISDA